ncbi:hypothetical protein ACE38V_05850 [Cytobacillus sp. Hz8]|uniref:hypothetical protein n=1 Tax=Cytobacillus sp. Hz8 TaxID=3347168 RepID=UPI0035DB0C3F
MTFALIGALAVIILVLFMKLNKHLIIFEYLFFWLLILFVFTTLFDVGTHHHLFSISNKVSDYYSLRLTEFVIIPVLLLTFLDRISTRKSVRNKLVMTVIMFLLLLGVETILRNWVQAFQYDQWSMGKSMMTWLGFFAFLYISHHIFQSLWIKGRYS